MTYRFVRFQSASPGKSGRYPGIFGVVNGLGRAGLLTAEEHLFWRTNNDWFNSALTYPPAEVYDRAVNPEAVAWFRTSAAEFVQRVPGYLAILKAHELGYVEMYSDDPGRILYEDEHQAIVAPVQLPDLPPRTES